MPIARAFPYGLALIFVAYFSVLAVDPVSRQVWIAEMIPVVLVFGILAITFPRFRFSNTAYALMSVWMFWHTLGGHYTFANVPFDWFSELIGSERNHFDRIGHFTVGFYAFAAVEWLLRRGHCHYALANAFGLLLIMGVAAAYEIIEWWYAALEGGKAGIEFLGSQGDIWDAQKDMFADTLGAIVALVAFALIRPDLAEGRRRPDC